ncbi:unnamed protein product, partial [Sphagnum troendelagicum]
GGAAAEEREIRFQALLLVRRLTLLQVGVVGRERQRACDDDLREHLAVTLGKGLACTVVLCDIQCVFFRAGWYSTTHKENRAKVLGGEEGRSSSTVAAPPAAHFHEYCVLANGAVK